MFRLDGMLLQCQCEEVVRVERFGWRSEFVSHQQKKVTCFIHSHDLSLIISNPNHGLTVTYCGNEPFKECWLVTFLQHHALTFCLVTGFGYSCGCDNTIKLSTFCSFLHPQISVRLIQLNVKLLQLVLKPHCHCGSLILRRCNMSAV